MELNRLQYETLKTAIHIVARELDMHINPINDRYGNESPLQYGVNWGGWGTQDVATTLKFAQNLQQAGHIAQMLTDMEITYSYTKDEPEITNSQYNKYLKAIVEMIKLQMTDVVVDILNKMA